MSRLDWWPGTESNRRRQPFQGGRINHLQAGLLRFQRDTAVLFGLQVDSKSRVSIVGLQVDSRFAGRGIRLAPYSASRLTKITRRTVKQILGLNLVVHLYQDCSRGR